jgi:hypothetical protein
MNNNIISFDWILLMVFSLIVGRARVVGVGTHHVLDNLRIDSRWGQDFPQPSTPALPPTQPPVQWVPRLFPGRNAAEVRR